MAVPAVTAATKSSHPASTPAYTQTRQPARPGDRTPPSVGCGGARLARTQPVIPASAWSPFATPPPIMPVFLVLQRRL